MTPEALSEEERRPVDLGAVAEAAHAVQDATTGPWPVAQGWVEPEEADAYIAAASPDVVLALVEAVRVAREALDEAAEMACAGWFDDGGKVTFEPDCLTAEDEEPCVGCVARRALVALDALVEPEDSDGHCAGPSWAAHKVRVVAEGEACPACGTVMP